jgi:hypothetical protein
VADKCESATLWNNSMSEWTRLFDGVEFSPELMRRINDTVSNITQDSLLERISAFDTPITEETLKFFVQ